MSSSRSRRMSMGGGALREVSAMHNVREGTKSRRTSMGGGNFRAETPKKDRHLQLQEYRQQQKRTRENETPDPFEYAKTKASTRGAVSSARPPTSVPAQAGPNGCVSFTSEGTSALERFRMRKQQKLQQIQHPSYSDSLRDGQYASNEDKLNGSMMQQCSSSYASTPHKSPHGAKSFYNLSQESEITCSQETRATRCQLSQESVQSGTDTVETVARYEEMQKRLRILEEEKMGITIAMAPIEARHRQKEDAWVKEQARLLQEIESLKYVGQSGNERYRDLEALYEAKEEENRQLRLQVRKESSSLYSDNTNRNGGAWSKHLQIDRDVAELKEKLQSAEDEIRSSRLARVSVEKELHATKIERDSIVRAYEEVQDAYEEVSKTTLDDREAQIKLEVLTTEHIATSAQLNAVCSDLAASKAAFAAATETKELEYAKEIEKHQFEISVLKTRAAAVADDNWNKSNQHSKIEDYAVLKARIEERDRKIAEFDNERLVWETIRRRMHNEIQELRGNIRVFVRTRPFLPSDGDRYVSAIDVSKDGESLSILDRRTNAPHEFKFDKAFPPSHGQDVVFQEVADFVQSAVDGYHVCLFSYGQTGSGKTHTMQGSGNGAMRGIIPRAVEQILIQTEAMRSQKWVFNLSASFLEIYNEDLKDLLVDMCGANARKNNKLSIKRSREGKSYVDNLTEISIGIDSSDEGMKKLDALMKVAARSRSVASTKMNAQSSRSHSVFMLHLRGFNEESGAEVHGAMNLCDLAGSERLDRSGANSDMKRLRETQAINKSLSCLGDVFNALAQKSSHVPYRNSKLTYLLQDCLSGDGKALMFVNLSPTDASSNESLCSLRFAQRVNQVELGKATKHVQYQK